MPVDFVEFVIESVGLLCQFKIAAVQSLSLLTNVVFNATSIVFNYFEQLPLVRFAPLVQWHFKMVATLLVSEARHSMRGLILFLSHHLNLLISLQSLKLQIRIIFCHPINFIRLEEVTGLDFVEYRYVVVVGIGHIREVMVQLHVRECFTTMLRGRQRRYHIAFTFHVLISHIVALHLFIYFFTSQIYFNNVDGILRQFGRRCSRMRALLARGSDAAVMTREVL